MDNYRRDGMTIGDEQPGQPNALAMMQAPGAEQAQKVQYICGCKYKISLLI